MAPVLTPLWRKAGGGQRITPAECRILTLPRRSRIT